MNAAEGRGGSGDLKPLRAEVFVLTSWTAGRIVELGPVLEAEAATLAGRRSDLEARGSWNGAGDMLQVIDDDLLRDHKVPGQLVQRPLPLSKHYRDLLSPRHFHRRPSSHAYPAEGVRPLATFEKPCAALARSHDQRRNS